MCCIVWLLSGRLFPLNFVPPRRNFIFSFAVTNVEKESKNGVCVNKYIINNFIDEIVFLTNYCSSESRDTKIYLEVFDHGSETAPKKIV